MNFAAFPMRSLALLLCLAATVLASPGERPNIVFILSDD